jgi:WD40 repeat protein
VTRHRDLPNIAFDLNYHFPIKFLSFSQRKFLGFRNRYEFDKKRVVFSSKRDFVVVGYDYEKKVYELLRSFVNPEEEIRFISFIEDHVPSFLLVITYNNRDLLTNFKILKLKKNGKYDHEDMKIEESKSFVA